MRIVFLLVTVGALVSGCATNLDGIRQFAKDVDKLATNANTQFAYMPTSCEHRLKLVELVRGNDSETAKETKAVCEELGASAKAAIGMAKGVTEYARALGSLAQDDLATYSSELDGLGKSLKGLKRRDQTPVVPDDKIDALQKLSNLILDTATQGLRQREIKRMFTEHDAVSSLLQQLAAILESEYVLALEIEESEYAGKLALLRRNFAEREPLRVHELEREFATARQGITDKKIAAKKSAEALRGLIAAHAALRDSGKLNTAHQLKEIVEFRKRVVEVRDAFDKAF
jgi:hypothetical protein